ncbi:MAG TPA: IPExxxVDY family protein [Sediminibacterium sp.]|nr:IPExxxVDY family protein [Sediminibacterium sp.]
MKLRLDVDELNDDFFEDTRLLGITATMKNYQFCMQLNNMLGYDFRLNPEIEIHLKKKNRSYYFSIYQYKEPNNSLVHYLYQNQFDGEYLLPEFKHMDFLWLMKYEYVDDEKCNWIRQTIRNLNGVQMIVELTNEQIKNKGNMVF